MMLSWEADELVREFVQKSRTDKWKCERDSQLIEETVTRESEHSEAADSRVLVRLPSARSAELAVAEASLKI